MAPQHGNCRRKERRFKTRDPDALRCDTSVNEEDPRPGTVIDISSRGLRFLCSGQFKVGQSFSTELKTDRSHGTFRGEIRRVQPWTGGKTVLGCQLIDRIPEEVLQNLAREGVVNRRSDERVEWNQPAKMSWELQQGEINVEIKDCSTGGLKIRSPKPIPDDLLVRIRVDMGDDDPLVIDARPVWQVQQDDHCVAGLAFTDFGIPEAVIRFLAQGEAAEQWSPQQSSPFRRCVLVVTAIFVLGVSLWQIGVWAHLSTVWLR